MNLRTRVSSSIAVIAFSFPIAWAQSAPPQSVPPKPAPRNPPSEASADPSPGGNVAAVLAQLDLATRRALSLQVALDRAGFSPGEIDGRPGQNTLGARQAWLAAGQAGRDKHPTAKVDDAEGVLGDHGGPETGSDAPLAAYVITAEDAAGPFVEVPADMMEKSKLPTLGYASLLELLAERFHSSPALLQRLNAGARFAAGESIVVPAVVPFVAPGAKAAKPTGEPPPGAITVTVTDRTKTLQVTDASGAVVFHAPVTVGSQNDPLPVGEWKVNGVSVNPTFNYNPDLFWDADPAHAKAKIPAGPNNPVGVVWIDLSKEHYGIHGTPEPSRIAYSESHGCIRLTNWDAIRLAALVTPGTKVILQ